ncbi:hypothetical protein MK489_20620 [Myxococcota bacterium]|nr:hypothetical protein [Myxococcota bacterium]
MVKRFLLSLVTGSIAAAIVLSPGIASAGYKMQIDETKWISLGAGIKGSFDVLQDASPNGTDWSKDFSLDNARIYIGGQIHEKITFEFNTECVFCGVERSNQSAAEEFVLLDAIAKLEINQYINIWGGRLLVPADRQEMNGPFYSATYDAFKTPFFSSDFSTDFGNGGAGVYGRDNGVNLWGAAGPDGALQYVVGVFSGLQSSGATLTAAASGPNQDDNLLWAGRIAYNFLSVEKNPGYYTSGTYYGTAGDIFTVAFAFQYQKDGAGSFENPGDLRALNVDVLGEFTLGNGGVFTFNGEYKNFDADYNVAAFDQGQTGNFGMFDGSAFTVTGLYLLPNEVWIGKLQPYFRFTGIYPGSTSADRDELEAGINYVIDGHNARISLFYQYGNLQSTGLNYAPNVLKGNDVSRIGIGVQLQI